MKPKAASFKEEADCTVVGGDTKKREVQSKHASERRENNELKQKPQQFRKTIHSVPILATLELVFSIHSEIRGITSVNIDPHPDKRIPISHDIHTTLKTHLYVNISSPPSIQTPL